MLVTNLICWRPIRDFGDRFLCNSKIKLYTLNFQIYLVSIYLMHVEKNICFVEGKIIGKNLKDV